MCIIAGFSGIGKSTYCKQSGAIDFECMPYKYDNYYEMLERSENREQLKADINLRLNWHWQAKYYAAILELMEREPGACIVIPSEMSVLKRLQLNQIPYTLVYPERGLKEEYRQRFLNRGNTENFIAVFYDLWDHWMDSLREDTYGRHVVLKANQYLSDVLQHEA